jgi:p-hydroxybenzoate 3-monooxygenase
MSSARTQVGIVGAGPAGLMLGHLLSRAGIESVILEARSEQHVIDRVRAGVLEQGTVDLMHGVGVGDRLAREGMRHDGLYLAFCGRRHHIPLAELSGGRAITVYGQNEIVKDLIAARAAGGGPLYFDAADVTVHRVDTDAPELRFRLNDRSHVLACDFVAGCDGFHGVCRDAIPRGESRAYDRAYPFAWLGILAEAAPSTQELVYSLHERGFALFSMRSPSVTRLYLQCAPDEDLEKWPDDRIWQELRRRLETDDGWRPNEGPIAQKSVAAMRSFVVEPMRYKRMFLAGDAAHIVPPTGAKGLNLAMADVSRLATALEAFYQSGNVTLLNTYSDRAVARAWRAQRFSWWMTSTLHRVTSESEFDHKRQLAELDYLVSSRAAMTSFAENYTGTPFD